MIRSDDVYISTLFFHGTLIKLQENKLKIYSKLDDFKM